MILLKNLKLHDFLSHSDTEIDFQDGQKTLLDGSSGSGKSSIFEAIIWALYGTGRSSNSSLVRRGEKKAEVVLTLTEDDTEYEITRSVTAKGKHTLSVTKNGLAHELAGLKEIQTWIEKDLIGASYLLFVNSIAYLQGGADTFVTQTAARRKELLLEIVKTDNLEDHYNKARDLVREYEKDLKVNENSIEVVEAFITESNLRVSRKKSITEGLKETKEELATSQKNWSELSVEKAASGTLDARIRATQSTVADYKKDIEDVKIFITAGNEAKTALDGLETAAETYNTIKAQTSHLDSEIKAGEDVVIEESTNMTKRAARLASKPEVGTAQAELGILDKEEVTWKGKPDCPSKDACPYMTGKTSRLTEIQTERTRLFKDVVNATEELNEWDKLNPEIPARDITAIATKLNVDKAKRTSLLEELHLTEVTLSKRDDLKKTVETLPKLELKLEEKNKALVEAELIRDNLIGSSDPTKALELDSKIDVVNAIIKQLQDVVSNGMAELKVIEKLEKDLVDKHEKCQKLVESQKKLNSDIGKLSLLKEALGSKGIKAVVIDYLLPNLEEKINDILAKMSDFTVNLNTQKTGSDGETQVEGLFISVYNESGEEMDFDLYSGGEKLKIVVAISEALATLQNVGFRLFDEIFVGLDENSTESFNVVLRQLQTRFNQVLCISHLTEIKAAFDDQLFINKHNGISHVR